MSTNLATDASQMLAAALEQMDDIIAGTKMQQAELQNGTMESHNTNYNNVRDPDVNLPQMARDFQHAIQDAEDRGEGDRVKHQVPELTRIYLTKWLQGAPMSSQANGNGTTTPDTSPDATADKLEEDRQSLNVQVNALTEQVESQENKVQDLEKQVGDERDRLAKTEAMLQEEMHARSSLETAKLNLMTDISNLRIKLSGAENDIATLKERAIQAEAKYEEKHGEATELNSRYQQSQRIISELQTESHGWQEKYMQRQVKLVRTQSEAAELKAKLRQSHSDLEQLQSVNRMGGNTPDRTAEELAQMKHAIETLMSANREKDKKIDELRRSLQRYKKIQEMVMSAQGRKVDINQLLEEERLRSDSYSTGSSATADTTDSPSLEDKDSDKEVVVIDTFQSDKEVVIIDTAVGEAKDNKSVDEVKTEPVKDKSVDELETVKDGDKEVSFDSPHTQSSSPIHPHHPTSIRLDTGVVSEGEGNYTDGDSPLLARRSASLEDVNSKQVPNKESSISQRSPNYNTLPSPRRNKDFIFADSPTHEGGFQQRRNKETSKSFGKGLFKNRGAKKTSSAPNLAMTESDTEEYIGVPRKEVTFDIDGGVLPPGTPPAERNKKKGGIKKLIGKLKRSSSASMSLDDDDLDYSLEFQRGGRLRATAGARLGWSKELRANGDIDTPFAKWDTDHIVAWLHEMGLGQYTGMCRVWVKNGSTLLKATPIELERDLGVKHHLHRKKLQLALQCIGSEQEDRFGDLDYSWVLRWLDDVGLPQYKDSFSDARIDGRMLHYLTVDDLLSLKVTSAFHHVSIMRGIQCLRLNNFQPNCLRRRPTDERWFRDLKTLPAWSSEMHSCHTSLRQPYEGTEVMLWTNHRVMEWLRSVDLSEYAPNLRGSGVHGGLMVLEPRFTAETLAALLSIPSSKTLLRRHLNTHFVSLVGIEVQAYKREIERQPNYIPLNQLAKIKPRKKSFAVPKKRRGGFDENEDYVCPMDVEPPPCLRPRSASLDQCRSQSLDQANGSRPVPSYRVEQNGGRPDDPTAHQIGAFSQEINTLTNMLANENFDSGTHV